MDNQDKKVFRIQQTWLNGAIALGSFTFLVGNSNISNNQVSTLFLLSMCCFLFSMSTSAYLVFLENMTFSTHYTTGVSKKDEEMNDWFFKIAKKLEGKTFLSGVTFLFGIFFALLKIHYFLGGIFPLIAFFTILSTRRHIKQA